MERFNNWVAVRLPLLARVPNVLLAIVRSKIARDGAADCVLRYLSAEALNKSDSPQNVKPHPGAGRCRLFGWELSYFSGKVRAYLRYKARHSDLLYEEVVASPDVVATVLVPATKSNTVPQVQLPNGEFIHDSTEIIDVLDRLWPSWPVLPSETSPRQRLTCQIIELLADEWMLVPAFHWRWAYSGDGTEAQRMPAFMAGIDPLPNHREYNLRQWGAFLRPEGAVSDQVRAAKFLFDNIFLGGIGGIKNAMVALGVTEGTVAAWEASCLNVLTIFEHHLEYHPFVLGARPSTADFSLVGPIWAHLLTDPVPGAMMREEFPHVTAWCERLHDRGGAAGPGDDREEGDWLPGDEVPQSVMPLLQVFVTEMLPVLVSTCHYVTKYLAKGPSARSEPLPGKSFAPTSADQEGSGPLTHTFSLPFGIRGEPGAQSHGSRMVLPYQLWMLQRIERTLSTTPPDSLTGFVQELHGGSDLLRLPALLKHCRVRKEGGLIYPALDDQDGLRSRL